jgi:predicted RNA-binding Zn-ribbon protein involved in translation (DUF1610 family)
LSSEEKEKIYREAKNLLDKMIANSIKELTPEIDSMGNLRFYEAEKAMDKDHVHESLEKLSKFDIFQKKFYDKIVVCPFCNSKNVTIRLHCVNCLSINIERKALLEHGLCGAIEDESFFKKSEACPNCGRIIIESDLRKIGSWFQCNSCNTKFDEPIVLHFCRNCKKEFRVKDAKLESLYSYILTPSTEEEFKRKFILLTPVKKALEQLQYKVFMPGKLIGESGTEHQFSITALKDSGGMNETIVLDMISSNTVVDETVVAALFAKIFDTKPTKAFLIAIPRISENGKKMAQLYKINIIEAKEIDEASVKLIKLLKSA